MLAAHPWLQDAADMTTAVLFLNVIVTLKFSETGGWSLFAPTWHKTLADFSFSLYCIHTPLLIFVRAGVDFMLGPNWTKQPATSAQWMLMGATMSVVIALAYVFSRYTEAKTLTARKVLRSFLARFDRPVVTPPANAPALARARVSERE
jgi:peptidoglycan/LPS O-acetylase OafA/YrhL